ncbi:MAG: DNA-directed RNA polymerase subunit beta [Coriobacteriales bacterium]|nr:DNA-directed RNA polymerase subunit beta [Coriobacteriales bacterium]
MPRGQIPASTALYRERKSFAKIPEVMDVPNLISIQVDSFNWFKTDGLAEAFRDISPIENSSKNLQVEFGAHEFGDPKFSVDECKAKDISYQAALFVEVRFINTGTGEIKEQEVFMGDFPLMTPRGTFVINGTERVVVSQLVRSPGVYFSTEPDKTSDKMIFNAKVIPSRGAWLEFETDRRDILSVRVDRKRKQPATLLLRALGIANSREEILELLGDSDLVLRTLDRDNAATREDALIELYKRLRPGEPPTVDSARTLLEGLFFNPQRYDLARVGRYKINKKLGIEAPGEQSVLTHEDIVKTMRYIVDLHAGDETKQTDDIDHFGNRRIRTVGELIQNQFRIGLSRMERVVRERMSTQEVNEITPQSLINIRPIVAAIKEFFGSSQLSQFMDQTNPATGITHKRRLSALGPGGLSRERAGFEVRDVHTSHYGRMCPIETPEGPNIGLIGTLATYARVNPYGFIEAPYRRVVDGKVTDDIDYLTADEEENFIIAQANELFDQETCQFGQRDENGEFVPAKKVLCRVRDAHGVFGEPEEVDPKSVQYMDVSPRQMVSVATALIPFLEHDDANRALMGSNMQRQAVPLLKPSAPLVGTGMEHRCAVDSGEIVLARRAGVVEYVQTDKVTVRAKDGSLDQYELPKFQRSNQSGCLNHKPLVRVGQEVFAGDVLADGPATELGELSLGQNLLVAYMPWEGFNYEDAIILSERVVSDDLLTSIHISQYEVDARDTKLGPEEITREIPNISDEMVANLDADGIIRIGAEVFPGDVLVGKVTPKGETELTAEERLLRAIFGEKAREVRDTSLKVPHGSGGRIIGISRFSRDSGDELSPGVNELVRVYVAQKRKIQQGDKLAGRHGNKGVISRILPIEDMPYLADGTPIDIIMNPLGVPSRMNVGQLLETHLGWAAHFGWSDEETERSVEGPMHVATPVFDGATESEISRAIDKANRNLLRYTTEQLGELARKEFIPQLTLEGKTWLYDGRTGERFREPITVGWNYILKLSHLVDDKIHARSTGPYSLITQQPLGGKAQFGGQRFGEMEVWALYAYGASHVLQEILTIKSDDTAGRVKSYEHIVKGENIPAAEVPESFKVLVKEMKSLCLDVELIGEAREESLEDFSPEEPESLASVLMMQDFDNDEDALDLIASGLDDLDFGDSRESLSSLGESLVAATEDADNVGTLFEDDAEGADGADALDAEVASDAEDVSDANDTGEVDIEADMADALKGLIDEIEDNGEGKE